MCGIISLINKHFTCVEPSLIDQASRAIAHRGPDDTVAYFWQNVGVGFVRLSIVDINGGRQPFVNSSQDIVLVCNGEIYNYRQLRENLSHLGYTFTTQSDCEVILHLYQEDNEDFVKYLEGMFAFVIIDKRRNKIVMGRDRLGIKPLFYANTPEFFGCCSEIKGLFATQVFSCALNPQHVKDGLVFNYVPGQATVFDDVYHLPPATVLEYNLTTNTLENSREYWQPEFRDKSDQGSLWLPKYTKPLAQVLRQAVASHCIGEVAISSYLSGGIDSTIVTGLLAEQQKSKQVQDDFCSFSIAFQEKEFDESEIFKKTISKFGIKSEILETKNIFNGKLFYETIASIEQPQTVPMDIPFQQLSQLVRSKNRKVVLVGEGSDELFGGYLSFVLNNLRWFFATDIGEVFKDALLTKCLEYFLGASEFAKQLEQIYREDNSRVIELFGTYPAWYPYWRLTQESLQNIFHDDLQDSLAAGSLMQETLNSFREKLANLSEFDQSVYVELKTRLPNYILVRADRNSMANSIEQRLPFLDNNVIDTALKTPTVFKMLGIKEKFILKSAFKKVVPRHVRKRRKFGYSSPNSWVWDKPDELTLSLMSKASLDRVGVFNSAEVLKMLEDIKREDFKANAITYQATLSKLTGILSVQILHDKYVKC